MNYDSKFAQQIAAIYNSFAKSQKRLEVEFEAAIFSDLESLYENDEVLNNVNRNDDDA